MIEINASQEQIERALIGSLIAEPDKYLDVAPIISERDFLNGIARNAFATIGKLYRAGTLVDLTSVASAMGPQYITWLAESELVHGHNAVPYAIDLSQRGTIRRIQSRMKELAGTNLWDGADELTSALRLMYLEEAASGQQSGGTAETDKAFAAKVEEYQKRGCIGTDTGFQAYESENVFYEPGHMWVIGGWTSTGKTAFTVEKLRRLCWDRDNVAAYFSTEMTREQVYARYLANVTGYSAKLILAGRLDGHAARVVDEVRARQVEKGNLFIYDRLRTIGEIEIEAKKIKMQTGELSVFFIDYLQHLRGGNGKNRREQMVDISGRLQDLPKDIDGTGIYLSQVSNTVGKEDPGQLEFKEAGEFAADCDIGIQLKRAKEDPKIMLVDMRKNRHGPVFKFNVRFSEHWNRIEEGGI